VLVTATKVATDWGGCQGDDGMETLANGFGTERERERELAHRLHRRKEVAEEMLTMEELIGGTQHTGTTARSMATDGS
jgi:hypothetical protein